MANQLKYSFDDLPDYIKNAPAYKNPVEIPVVREDVISQPITEMPQMGHPIYDYMKKHGLTDLDESNFIKNYSTKENAKDIHDYMTSTKDGEGNPLTTLKFDDFYNQFLNPYNNGLKKKDFATTGVGSENLSQDLENIENLGDGEGPGKKKKKTTEFNLTSDGKLITGELKAKVLAYMAKNGQKVIGDMDINPAVINKLNSSNISLPRVAPAKQLIVTKDQIRPGEDEESAGFRIYAENQAREKEQRQLEQYINKLNRQSSNHGFVQLDENDPYYPGYINSLTGGRPNATIVAGAINKSDFQNYKAGVIAEETKKAAIQNTLNRKAYIKSGPNSNRASDSTMLVNGLNNGEYVITQDDSGYPILGLADNNFFNQYDETYKKAVAQDAYDNYFEGLSDEDKIKYKENEAYGNSINQSMPQVPSGFFGNAGSFAAGLQRAVEKPIIYGIGAITGTGLAAELGVAAASLPEVVEGAKNFGTALGWAENLGSRGYNSGWDKSYYGQLANIPNPTEAQKLAAAKIATESANYSKLASQAEGVLMSMPFGKLTPGLNKAAKNYENAIQTVRKAAPVAENNLLNKVVEVGKNAKTTVPQMYGASFAGELGRGEIAKAYGSGESHTDILSNANEAGKSNAGMALGFSGLHLVQAVVPHALSVLMAGKDQVPSKVITNRAYNVAAELPTQNLKDIFAKAEQDGILKPGEGDQIIQNIEDYKKAKSLVPKNITNPEAAISMAGMIQKIEKLKAELETTPVEARKKDIEAEIADYDKKINDIYHGDDPYMHETDKLGNPIVQTAGISGKDIKNMIKGVTDFGSKAYGKVKELITGKEEPLSKDEILNKIVEQYVPDVNNPDYELTENDKARIQYIQNNPIEVINNVIENSKNENNPKLVKTFEKLKENYINSEKAESQQQTEQVVPTAEIPVSEEDNQPLVEEKNEKPVVNTKNKKEINQEVPAAEGPQRTSGVSHAALENLAERLGLPKIERGTVLKPEEYAARGRRLVDGGVDPESVRDNVSNPTPDEISIARAHLIDLDNLADKAKQEFGADSPEYKDAVNKVDDWARNVVKIQNTTFGERGTAMQGVTDLDTGSFSSVARKLKDNLGRDLTPEEEAIIQKKADQNKASTQAQKDSESALVAAHENDLGEGAKPTEGAKLYKEKAKVAADKFRKLKTKEFTFKDENGNDIPIHKMGLAWNDIIEIGAKAIEATGEVADGVKAIIDEVKDKDWYKNLSKRDKANFEDQLTSHFEIPIEETPESKNIARLEKQLDDLQNGKYKEKTTPRELSDREKELKAQIKAEKEKLGLINSKTKTPLTEEEELSNLQAQFVNKKDNKFTTDEAKSIWRYMKKKYIDNGVEYNEALKKTGEDLGMTYEQVANSVVTPRTKKAAGEYFVKRSTANKNREATKRWVEEKNQSKSTQIFRKIFGFPKAAMTFGHGHVFVGTHGITNIVDPVHTAKTLKAMVNSYKYAYGNRGNYERDMEALKNHPLYSIAREAGLANDPDVLHFDDQDNYDSFIKRVGETGKRGFNAIKVLRQQIFNNEYENLTDEQKQDPKSVERIAKLVNNWTGATNVKLPSAVQDAAFSANMEASRWERLGSGPKAVSYLLKGLTGNGTPDEKAFAKAWFKRAGRQLATYGTLLGANAAVQAALHPDRKVNLTDPTKSDFLLPKFGNHDVTVDLSGGLLSTVGLLSRIGKYAVTNEKNLPRGKSRGEAEWGAVGSYLRGKLNPATAIAIEAATGKDFNENVVPWSSDKPKGEKRQLGWGEYLAGHVLPLPLAEGFRTMQKSAEENGVTKGQFNDYMKGLETALISGATGIKTKEVKDDMGEPLVEQEKVMNFNEGGRPITPQERKTLEAKSEELYNKIDSINKNEGFWVMEGDSALLKSYNKGVKDENGNLLPVATKEEKYKEINRAKEEAALLAKKLLFGTKSKNPNVSRTINEKIIKIQRGIRKRLLTGEQPGSESNNENDQNEENNK